MLTVTSRAKVIGGVFVTRIAVPFLAAAARLLCEKRLWLFAETFTPSRQVKLPTADKCRQAAAGWGFRGISADHSRQMARVAQHRRVYMRVLQTIEAKQIRQSAAAAPFMPRNQSRRYAALHFQPDLSPVGLTIDLRA